jgi:hypothetical protein
LPSYNSPSGALSVKPGTPEYAKYLEQKRLAGLNQIRLDKTEALEKSRESKIGDCNTSDKHPIRCVVGPPPDDVFKNSFRESRLQSAKPNALNSHPISIENPDN